MKKIILTLLLLVPVTTFAAPWFSFSRSILPIDSTENMGTSTLPWDIGFFNQLCLSGDCKTSWPTGGSGGTGNVSTSTAETAGNLAYWTSTNGTPATLGSISTSTFLTTLNLTKGSFLVGGDNGIAQATSSIFVSSVGRVGIGTSTPAQPLVVQGSGSTGGGTNVPISQAWYSSTGAQAAWLGTNGTTNSALVLGNSGNKIMSLNAGSGGSGFEFDSSGGFVIQTATNANVGKGAGTVGFTLWGSNQNVNIGPTFADPGVRFRVESGSSSFGGNVGIGVANPGSPLDISGSATGAATIFNITNTANNATLGFFQGLAPNIPVGGGLAYTWGQSASTNNRAFSDFYYAGSGSSLNRIDWGFFGAGYLMALQANGNVGIGVTNPSSKLQIGSLTASQTATPITLSLGGTYSDTAGANPKLKIYEDASSASGLGASAGSLDFIVPSATSFNWYVNGANKMTLNSSGNLSVGSTTPWGLLSVNANGLAAGTPQFVVGSSTATNFLVANSGNVGIGTTTPAAKLDIYTASSTAGTVQSNPFSQLVEMVIGGVYYMVDSFDYYGHLITGGPTPTVSTCGTSPAITGNDRNMRVMEGSSAGTSCLITFAKPYVNPPICIASQETGTASNLLASSTPSTVTVTGTGALSSVWFTVHCEGYR